MTLHPYEVTWTGCSARQADRLWAVDARSAAVQCANLFQLHERLDGQPDQTGLGVFVRPWLGGSRGQVFSVAELELVEGAGNEAPPLLQGQVDR